MTASADWCDVGREKASRINILPDDVVLEIFYFYVNLYSLYGGKTESEKWQSLVHVCRRWRSLVSQSPRRLNLRLYCSPQTPAKDKLDVWPALPLVIQGRMTSLSGTDNVISALGQSNHVCKVDLWDIAKWQFEKVLAAMQVPFTELIDLRLFSESDDETPQAIPDSFLDGSARSLQTIRLSGIPFPGLPKLLLSANHLATLWLSNIPHSGYISPEAIVTLISVLSSLDTLHLRFQSPQSCPASERQSWSLPSLKRSILPALRRLNFKGATEYLEELVTRIDTPQLNFLDIIFFNQIDFDYPRLAQFINRTPTLRTRDDAQVRFNDHSACVGLPAWSRTLEVAILCGEPDWQLSSIEQVCNSLPPVSTVEDLYIEHRNWKLVWKDDAIENTLWLQFLLPFAAVKNLYLSKQSAPGIAATLDELVGDRITEVLPNLQSIFVEGLEPSGPFQECIGRFVAARQLSDHPIAISVWRNYR